MFDDDDDLDFDYAAAEQLAFDQQRARWDERYEKLDKLLVKMEGEQT